MNQIIESFAKTRFWSQFFGIIMIIFFAFSIFSFVDGFLEGLISMIINAFVYLIPGLVLMKYAKHVTLAENGTNAVEDLEAACEKQGFFFKYVGIMTLVFVIIMLIAIIFMIAMGPILMQSILQGGF